MEKGQGTEGGKRTETKAEKDDYYGPAGGVDEADEQGVIAAGDLNNEIKSAEEDGCGGNYGCYLED
eukprot:CAMPEP_0198278434 /NCGR_PEP_ID=MMETSP1447-20131203/66376_1 /TAXON_ID=420782 /ORGANISM="Chaetoceros dichaeta, Strain CCMP1751" /LENGTH=65 /DNA_ID=CAMNT_0043973513 /DNA_START=508 /DNA_END=705 /DNA_ORIENTATION=+